MIDFVVQKFNVKSLIIPSSHPHLSRFEKSGELRKSQRLQSTRVPCRICLIGRLPKMGLRFLAVPTSASARSTSESSLLNKTSVDFRTVSAISFIFSSARKLQLAMWLFMLWTHSVGPYGEKLRVSCVGDWGNLASFPDI
jgi:hypothetical protein